METWVILYVVFILHFYIDSEPTSSPTLLSVVSDLVLVSASFVALWTLTLNLITGSAIGSGLVNSIF